MGYRPQGIIAEARRATTLTVAASDSKDKARADYVCDGVADNVEIQAAIDALPAAGGRVTLSEGKFVLAAQVNLSNYVSVEGQGYSTEIELADKTLSGLSIDGLIGASIRNLRIDGIRAGTDSGAGQLTGLIRVVVVAVGGQCREITVENVWLENAYSVAICANSGDLAGEVLEGVYYHNIHVRNCNWDLLILGGDTAANRNRLVINGFFSEDTLQGVSCGTMNGCIFRNFYSTSSAVYGGVTLDSCRNFRFSGGNVISGSRALCIVAGSCTSYGISFEDYVVKGLITAYLENGSYDIHDIKFENIRAEGGVAINFDFHTHATPQAGATLHGLWLLDIHSEGATQRDFYIVGVAATPLNQVRLTRCTAKSSGSAENYTLTYIDDLEMIGCDGANGTNVVVAMTNCAVVRVIGGYYRNATGWNIDFDLSTVTHLVMTGVKCLGTRAVYERTADDYNIYQGNNWRDITGLNQFLGAHNVYDLEIISTGLDLSGGATDLALFHAVKPCVLAGYHILYSEASSADAGVNVRVGRYQDGVALDDDYFDVEVSEASKNLGYAKYVPSADLLIQKILAGDTVTVGTAGGKVGAGEVKVILHIAEMAS